MNTSYFTQRRTVLDTLLQLMESYGYIAMFFAMAAENANIPIPSEVILGFAGFLISQGVFEFMPTFIIACLAGIFISFPAGVARYPFFKFIILTTIGTIPWTWLLVWAGSVLGSHWRDLIEYNHIFLIALIVLAAVIALVFFIKRRGK